MKGQWEIKLDNVRFRIRDGGSCRRRRWSGLGVAVRSQEDTCSSPKPSVGRSLGGLERAARVREPTGENQVSSGAR